MKMNNKEQNQGYHMLKKWFKTIWKSFWDKIYKKREVKLQVDISKYKKYLRIIQIANYTTTSPSHNPYIPKIVNNLDFIVTLNQEKKNCVVATTKHKVQ